MKEQMPNGEKSGVCGAGSGMGTIASTDHAPRRPWSKADDRTLRDLYSEVPTAVLARRLSRTERGIYARANAFGLLKSAAYLASPEACRLRRGDTRGAKTRFPPGHVPANKGLRRPGWGPGRMKQTQFLKGHMPQTWKPIGSTRISKDGYLQRKVTDTRCPSQDWRGEHILLWEQKRGPVPSGHAVCFKDGNKSRIKTSNLELIPRSELMRRNSVHRLPPELAQVIQLTGALKRKMRNRANAQEQAARPA